MSIPRLTPERAATVDGLAKRDEALCPAMTSSHQLRILDLLDENAALRARAEQDERDRAGPGAELSDGRWACSEECWDALAGPPDAPSVVRLHGLWRTDMENAPTDTLLAVRAGGMTFDASLRLMDDGCWAWVAEHEEVHPWCWTDGRCWARNENNKPSAPVTHWQPLPPAPKGGA